MKLILFFMILVGSVTAQATGGFDCKGTDKTTGETISASACVPHSINSLCGDLSIYLGISPLIDIPIEQVPAFYSSQNFTGVMAYDEYFDQRIFKLEYFGDNDPRNIMEFALGSVESFDLKNITCLFE